MPETKEWTLMFYLASDNPLAISIVSQLKALKNAGFHHEVNVITQFDPFTKGTPTHIFDVNVINKLKHKESNVGFHDGDSFMRNLIEDRLWREEKNRDNKPIRDVLSEVLEKNHGIKYEAPRAPNLNGTSAAVPNGEPHQPASGVRATPGNGRPAEPNNGPRPEPPPFACLQTFLTFCADNYPARHYMLFMLGHGVVVGNDIFMYDEHAEQHSITLQEMGVALSQFKSAIAKHDATFDLVGFHSCSVSSLEVAYELKGTADYMLASQGPTFVGSWPYRQILVRVFRDLGPNGKTKDIRQLITDIYNYCLHSSADFLLAGYSHQLTLCDLRKVTDLKKPMTRFSTALMKALVPGEGLGIDAASLFIILYSHWKAQSFFQEMYTDLYDFCFCIVDRCERLVEGGGELTPRLTEIRDACADVMAKLAKPDVPNVRDKGKPSNTPTVVVASEFVGPAYQYSRGLSVYFPWSRPSVDRQVMQQYEKYKFLAELKDTVSEPSPDSKYTWFNFLDRYFDETQRRTKRDEIRDQLADRKTTLESSVVNLSAEQILLEDMGSLVYNGEGSLGGVALAKDSPSDKTGEDCECSSFKNYPRDIRGKNERRRTAQAMPLTETLLGDF